MPKIKVHRGAAKRFKLTKSGKIKKKKAYKSHILEKKSSQRKRRLYKQSLVHPSKEKKIKKMLAR